MYKSFEVNSICREDLTDYISKEKAEQIDDATMENLASKLGDALQDLYWISLEVLIKECDILKV